MTLLLDTNAFLWSNIDDTRLGPAARLALADPNNDRIVSVATIWEISIKVAIGKLTLTDPVDQFVTTGMRQLRASPLAIELTHALHVSRLPHHHRDPFDRILISQAMVEGMTIVSSDRLLAAYQVPLIW